MRLRIAATALLVLSSCKSPSESVNRVHGDAFSAKPKTEDIMGAPSAIARRPSEEAPERAVHRLPELVGVAAFKPSKFKFDRLYTLYEDGKGNAQIRRGTEIIEEGQIGKERSKDGFTLYSKDGYEIVFHKSGLGTITATPDEIKDRDRPISK